MARKPRLRLPDIPQHVVQRGNNRQQCFFQDDDFAFYLECLRVAAQQHCCELHAYALMPNHVHLLATPRHPEGVGLMMQAIGRRYVRYVNRVHRRSGTLWEGRYRASAVEAANYFLACARFIELNPVRAGLVATPAAYRWTSYHANALGEPDSALTPHPSFNSLGRGAEARQRAWRNQLTQPLSDELMRELRRASDYDTILGSEGFKVALEQQVGYRLRPGRRGRPRKGMEMGEASRL